MIRVMIKKTDKEKELKQLQEKANIKKYRETPIFGKTKHRIIKGDSRKMSEIKNESVSLVVTSPPYYNAKDYSQWKSLEDYGEDMKKVFKEVFRVLEPGRRFCLNISDIPTKGDSGVKWLTLGPLLLHICEDLGFELADRIFWFKTPLKGFNYGSLPYPPSPLVCDSTEYIYILRKPGKADYKKIEKERKEASKLIREEYGEYTKQIWTLPRVRLADNADGHIAPFPETIPFRCIKLYSFVGETILDPFGGSGTTTKVAAELKRHSIMYEIKKDYIKLAKKRIESEVDGLYINPEFIYE